MLWGLDNDRVQPRGILKLLGNVADVGGPNIDYINYGNTVAVPQPLAHIRIECGIVAKRRGRIGHAIVFIYRAPKLLLPQDTGS